MPSSANNQKPNWQILYKALTAGYEYEIDGIKLAVDDEGHLCHQAGVYKNRPPKGEPDEINYYLYQIDFNTFIKDCERIPKEDIIDMVFFLGIDDRNRKEKRGKYRDDR